MGIVKKHSAGKIRAMEILVRLKRLFPDAPCTLTYSTPIQLLVAVILSAQCTDERVNLVTPELFRRFPDAKSISAANPDELMELVRSTGFYRNKAKNIQAACTMIEGDFGGEIPRVMEDLLKL
ncbi:MAG: endonuclease III, partial [Pseudanabaena sp. CRU_2_10]|nr:endonuclease III [Pseudanabaena sp. CRU_2_10]